MNPLRWRLLVISILTLWGFYSIAPSVIYFTSPKEVRNSDEEMREKIPDWLPQKHAKLGLDLQGGVQLVLGVNTDNAVDNKLSRLGTEAQRWSDETSAGVSKAYVLTGKQRLRVELKDGVDSGAFREKFRKEYPGVTQVGREGQVLDFAYDDQQIRHIKDSAIEQAERVVRNRIDKWGVAEPIINRRQADNSILVQLPGFKDPSKAKELLGRTAQLQFKLVDDKFTGFGEISKSVPEGITVTDNGGQLAFVSENREALLAFVKDHVPSDRQLFLHREDLAGGKKSRFTTYVVEASTEITGDDVLEALVSEDSSGLDRRPVVSMRLTGPGGKRFGELTGANIGRRLAIVLDDVVESAPVIQSRIATGQAQITLGGGRGYNEMFEEANELSLILKSGALPATIEVLEERQVGASLGPELADQGMKGFILGLACVLVFMVAYYRRPGLVACLALVLNGVFLLALMGAFGFALTLPGIAGFVLTLGMAVDANVLINERIHQELSEGKNAKKAVENGFSKVFWTIIDSNATTLIAALVLLETNASGPIRGFAVTLIIGLLVSLFTSLYVSRTVFDLVLANSRSDKQIRAWLGETKAATPRVFNFNFLRFGKLSALIGILIVMSVIGVGAIRGINWGVDFAGGTELMLAFKSDTTPGEIEKAGASVGIKSMTLQALEGGQKQYLVRFGAEDLEQEEGGSASDQAAQAVEARKAQALQEAIKTQLAAKEPTVLAVDYVGPQIGAELRNQGFLSLFYALIGIMIYIALRFDMRFTPGIVFKMINDLFIMLAFYVFMWRAFDLTAVAACLTVIGYSVNDVIVIYDRIRENLTLNPKRSLWENINNSLNETLTRSINTSVTVLLSLVGILIFATGQIWNFGMGMAIGVVGATLSSTFLASSCVLWFEMFKMNRKVAKSSSHEVAPATARS